MAYGHAARLEAVLITVSSTYAIAATVVALPPSTLDTSGTMRVVVGGTTITRIYDPAMEQP